MSQYRGIGDGSKVYGQLTLNQAMYAALQLQCDVVKTG